MRRMKSIICHLTSSFIHMCLCECYLSNALLNISNSILAHCLWNWLHFWCHHAIYFFLCGGGGGQWFPPFPGTAFQLSQQRGYIVWGTWMSVPSFMAICPKSDGYLSQGQSGELSQKPSDRIDAGKASLFTEALNISAVLRKQQQKTPKIKNITVSIQLLLFNFDLRVLRYMN